MFQSAWSIQSDDQWAGSRRVHSIVRWYVPRTKKNDSYFALTYWCKEKSLTIVYLQMWCKRFLTKQLRWPSEPSILKPKPKHPLSVHVRAGISGWHESCKVCLEANVVNRVCHQAATVHVSSDFCESDRETFYKHLGHSKDIDLKVYHCHSVWLSSAKWGNNHGQP